MKKLFISVSAALMLSASLFAQKNHNLGLVTTLPLPMKVLIKQPQKLDITEEQTDAIATMMQKFPVKIHALFDKAEALEDKIKEGIFKKGYTNKQLDEKLTKLATIKREITEQQIEAIAHIRTILTKEQFGKMVHILKNMKKQHPHGH